MPTTRINGLSIYYQVFGNDGPWLTLVTGGRRGHQEFAPLAARIAQGGFRVLLHDRRNTGASDIRIAGDVPEEILWSDDLASLLDHVGASPAFVGGSSAGARLAIRTALRHPDKVRALLLMRVTGGAFAAGRLPDMYYGQFIAAAEQGGMEAVCATEQYQERIAANPENRARLMAMDAADYIAVMRNWQRQFENGADQEVMGVTPEQLAAIAVPTLIIPGNDRTHNTDSGLAAHRMIKGSQLHRLPLEFQDVPLVEYIDWAPQEPEIARVMTDFMRAHP